MTNNAALSLNSSCYCWPVDRNTIMTEICAQPTDVDMKALLEPRSHYFANTGIFLDPMILGQMTDVIKAIEDIAQSQSYRDAIESRDGVSHLSPKPSFEQLETKGVFMGYDFHITDEGPKLIEINSNAGGAFIVNMIERAASHSSGSFAPAILKMFQKEWALMGLDRPLKTLAIIDAAPTEQYHYPDMCLAKSLLEAQGLTVIIADPKALRVERDGLYHGSTRIDLVYNRLTDFDLSEPGNAALFEAYQMGRAVITPAPHHHRLYADKRNLIWLSDSETLSEFGATQSQIETLRAIPKTQTVTPSKAEALWAARKTLFFKPKAGFGSRGAFRGAKLTKKVWAQILEGGYIAQDLVAPPVRAVTVEGSRQALKFDVRVYSYDGTPLLYAARIYQGQTTNLRTAGGGLAAVLPLETPAHCPTHC